VHREGHELRASSAHLLSHALLQQKGSNPQIVSWQVVSSQPGLAFAKQQLLLGGSGQSPHHTLNSVSKLVPVQVDAVMVFPVPVTVYHTPGVSCELAPPQAGKKSLIASLVVPEVDEGTSTAMEFVQWSLDGTRPAFTTAG
jgi:hypothetical protein